MHAIRPFQPSEEAYVALTSLWNALHPEWPRRASVWARIDARAPKGGFRLVADDGVRLVGAVDVTPADNGSFDVSLFAVPRPGGAALEPLFEGMCERLGRPAVLRAYVADSRPWLLDFFAARGFTCVQKTAYSRLDVAAFDLTPHEARAAKAVQRGIAVRSLADLSAIDPDWMRRYWELNCVLLREVPFEGGIRRPSLDSFAEGLSDPDQYNLDASFVALDGGTYVAASRLKTPEGIPDTAFTDLTGTLPSHRRQGLATLLKLATISYARAAGMRGIVTLNDVNNPMLALNRSLGFETKHIQHTVRAELF